MGVDVSIVEDSISPDGHRLTTLLVRLPMLAVITGTAFEQIQQIACFPGTLDRHDLNHIRPAIHDALLSTDPVRKTWGWSQQGLHLPFILDYEKKLFNPSQQYTISAARCLRATDPDDPLPWVPAEDIRLYQQLISGDPTRLDFCEHVAYPQRVVGGRYDGWVSLRHIFESRGVDWL